MNDNFEDNNNFWNDIYDDKVYLDNTKNLYLFTEHMKKEKKSNNIKYQNLTNLYNKYDYLIKEYCNEKNKNISTQTSFKNNKNNYFNILYNRGIAMNKKLEKIRKENEELKLLNELKECTFQPNLNLPNKTIKKHNLNNLSLYERNKNWLINKNENIIKSKRKNAEKLKKIYNYKPTIHYIDDKYLETIFNEENNIENQPENFSYLIRQYNVRNKNNKKNKSLDNSFFIQTSHYIGKDFGKKITKDDFESLKNYIHNEIQNIK